MKKVLALALMSLAILAASAQSAQTVSDILAKDAATYQDFSYLLASELGTENTPFEAFSWCERFGTFPADARPNTPITVKNASHFFMSNYGLPGGFMWKATKSPRYAWRELKHEGFWPVGTDPDDVLSGQELVQAISRFFDTWPEARLREPGVAEASHDYRAKLLANPEAPK